MSIWRVLLSILIAYVLVLFSALRWQLSYGPPISRETISLFVVFAMSAALVGLLSLAGVLGALHFSTGAAVVIVGSALLLKLWMEFAAWSPYAVWEMIQILAAQFLCLLIGFAVVRISGFQILQMAEDMGGPRGTRFSTRDLLVLMASVAVLFAVLGSTTPMISGRLKWLAIYATGGAAAALVVAAASWLCFGTKWTALRATVCLFVAPIGGLIYAIASQYSRLLYSWQWFAGVTATQMILIVIPIAVMRMQGFRFVRGR
jgi:hypothetical protein